MRLRARSRQTWSTEIGPYGRGHCLVSRGRDGHTRIIAPPGVPLAPPEAVEQLLRWRVVTWGGGRALGRPRALSRERVSDLAPSKRGWIHRTEAERERWEQTICRIPPAATPRQAGAEPLLVAAVAPAPARRFAPAPAKRPAPGLRTPLAKSRSASTFAAYVASLTDEAPVKLVARAADSARHYEDFRGALGKIERRVGHDELTRAVIALTHARARSHSWRYTQIVPEVCAKRSERKIASEIDRARSGQELERALGQLQSVAGAEGGAELYRILYRRSRSLRWRLTRPLRMLLANSRLRGVRRWLRERLRPEWRARLHGTAGSGEHRRGRLSALS
jgi:hypothetical protein